MIDIAQIRYFEHSRAVQLCVVLLKHNGPMAFTKLVNECGGSTSTVNVRIYELSSIGILEQEFENKFGGRRLVSLTEPGKEIADHFNSIFELISQGGK